MRTKKTLMNAILGLLSTSLGIILTFITRVIFIKYLNVEYLGYNALFSNIISVLSIAELGIGEAIAFSLFKPLYEKDYEKVSAIMGVFKKIYIIIGFAILVITLLITPFVHFLMTDYIRSVNEIRIFFLLYSMSTVVSYFFSYQRTLFFASQENYIVSIVDLFTKIILNSMQIIFLITTNNYYIYIVINIACSIFSNLFIYVLGGKRFKEIYKYRGRLTKNDKKDIFKQVKSLSITRLCTIGISSTDNIFISKFVGVNLLGIYSNYSLIILSVQSILSATLSGIKASIGDLISSGDKEKNYEIFSINCFVHYFAISICGALLYNNLNVFIEFVFGESYLMGMTTIVIGIFNLYVYIIQQPSWHIISTSGLFAIYRRINESQFILNIILSMFLGMKFGLNGIIFATAICHCISIVCVNVILYKNVFKNKKIIKYFYNQILFLVITIMLIISSNYLTSLIYITNPILRIALNFLITIICSLAINVLVFEVINVDGKNQMRFIISKLGGVLWKKK